MSIEQLKIGSRQIWMHKGIKDPDFKKEHVLSRDPWLYVELWLKRNRSQEALSFWSQARRFADASHAMSIEAAPLTLYYAFLNATKALLTYKGCSFRSVHGISGLRPQNAKTSLVNEMVSIKSGGILPDLSRYLGDPIFTESHSLKEILWNIPFIHRSFQLTYTSSSELFIHLTEARYVRKTGSTEAWFEAEVDPRFSDARSLKNIPDSFECNDQSGKKTVRRKKRFRWHRGKCGKNERMKAVNRLSRYHAKTRRLIVNISGNEDLWYLKRSNPQNSIGHFHVLTLVFAAMHRLSELSRYDPNGLDRHLDGQANWLLSEFIENSLDQFIDQISSEITGCQFRPPKLN